MPSEYTLKLTSNRTNINLPEKWHLNRLRFIAVKYTTASVSNEYMTISIDGLNNSWFYDGTASLKKYTKLIGLLPVASSTILYENYSNVWDFESVDTVNLSNFNIEVLINGVYSNSDISPSNPVYITMRSE